MKSEAYKIALPMTLREKQLIDKLARKSRLKSSELLRILLFETGILGEMETEQPKDHPLTDIY